MVADAMKYLWFGFLFGWDVLMVITIYEVFVHSFGASGSFGPLLIITIVANGYCLWVLGKKIGKCLKNKFTL